MYSEVVAKTDKIKTSQSDSYHHGDLPDALRAATAELVTERGTSGFSLREVARRAGVSHAAPAHHFGDAQGLLTSVAAEGFNRLADALEGAAVETNARDRLEACGQAYVRTALQYPGHFSVIFQADLVDHTDEAGAEASLRAYAALQKTVEMVRDELNPDLDIDTAATFCWAAMQGLVVLAPKLGNVAEETGTTTAPLEELISRFTDVMLTGLQA